MEAWSIIIILFGIGILIYAYNNIRRGEITINEYILLTIFSITTIITAINIRLIEKTARLLDFYRALDLITIIGFMIITITIIYLYKNNRRLEKKIEEIIIKIAEENKKDRRKK